MGQSVASLQLCKEYLEIPNTDVIYPHLLLSLPTLSMYVNAVDKTATLVSDKKTTPEEDACQ